MSKYLNSVSYFGGKFHQLTWLLPLLPKGNYHFVDIMAGSANVALNVNYPLITINDLNDEIVNLFHVLRENSEAFIKQIYLTPFSRRELANVIDSSDTDNTIEKARRYYVRCMLGYGANGSQNNHHGFGVEYKVQPSGFYRVDNWNKKLEKLPQLIEKLRSFQIENKDMFDLFERVNRPNTIVYFDPPYLFQTRSSKKRYKHEWSEDLHYKLASLVNNAECYVAISGFDHDIYNDLFGFLFKTENKPSKSNTKQRLVREWLWTNYDPRQFNNTTLKMDFNTVLL